MRHKFVYTLVVEREDLTDNDFDSLYEDFTGLKDHFAFQYPIYRSSIEMKRVTDSPYGLKVGGVPVQGVPKVKMELEDDVKKAIENRVKKALEDSVNSPKHYSKRYSKEVIESIKALSTSDEYRGYLKGNIIKYTARYQDKGGVEDLEKANWYNNALIKFEKEC